MSLFTGPEDVSAVVADFGTATTKIGYAGSDVPVAWFPTLVGQVLEETAGATASGPSTATSRRYGRASRHMFDVVQPREAVTLKSPLVDGLVEDWDLIESMLDYSIAERLHPGSHSELSLASHPFLLADHINASKADREKWCQLMFEKYKCPGVFMAKAGVLAIYANARTSGIAVDMGAGGTSILSVQDGFPLMMGARHHPVGGRTLDDQLLKSFQRKGISVQPKLPPPPKLSTSSTASANGGSSSGMDVDSSATGQDGGYSWHPSVVRFQSLELAKDIKESMCQMSESAFDPVMSKSVVATTAYELPDGSSITIAEERYGIPELILDPAPLGLPGLTGLHASIVASAMACEPEVRRDLVSNIVLTGGASGFKGMPDRLLAELVPIAPIGTRPKIAAASRDERKLGAWVGGSILGSLGTFHDLWFSAEEYGEHGAKMMHRKCP